MAHLEYFDFRRIALQKELNFHPDIQKLLVKHCGSTAKFEVILAEISSLFGIILDDYYSQEDLNNLCEILTKKLYEKRSLIILATK